MQELTFASLQTMTSRVLEKKGKLWENLHSAGRARDFTRSIAGNELKEYIKKKQQIKQLVEQILPQIQRQLEICKEAENKITTWHKQLNEQRCLILSFKKDATDKENEIEKNLKRLYDHLSALEKERDQNYALLQEKVEEVNRKKSDLRKWCWVPFYSLYLLGDYESSLKQYEDKCLRTEKLLESVQQQYSKVMEEAALLHGKDQNLQKLIELYKRENIALTERKKYISQVVVQWNQLYDFFTKMKFCLDKQEDIQASLEIVNKQLLKMKEYEQMLDYESFLQQEIFMGIYEIKSCGDDFNFVVENTSPILYHAANIWDEENEDVYHKFQCYFKIITFLDGYSLILDQGDRVLTYVDERTLCFELFEAEPDFNHKVFITKSGQEYQLKIKNNVGIEHCVEIQGRDFADYTPVWVQMPNKSPRQKFKLYKKI